MGRSFRGAHQSKRGTTAFHAGNPALSCVDRRASYALRRDATACDVRSRLTPAAPRRTTTVMTTTHSGGCHCGAVKYEVTGDFTSAMACNCSICSKKGSLLAFVPTEQFKLLQGEGALRDYQFNKHVIHHLFCTTCGIASFARGKTPKGGEMVAINVRCLDGVDLGQVAVKHFDGRSM